MSWWVGIGLSAAVLTMTPMKPMTSMTVPPTIPAAVPVATVPAVSTPSESSVSAGGDGDADVLGCDAPLFDPNTELDAPEVERAIERTARTLGADVHVRAEGTVDDGLDERMTQLEARCPTWTTGTERAGDLVVVMYSSVEREASVYYGADQALALDDRWEPAVDAMTVRFRVGDFSGGVVDGLEALGDPATSSDSDDARDDGGTDDESSDSPGVPGVVWLVIIGVAALLIYNIARFRRTGEWGDEASDDGGSSDWTSSNRRRSFGGFGSSARRSSRSSSRRSSSSTKRRSGGGTKKW